MVWPLGKVPAQVPAAVHQVLFENGIIADPLTHAHAVGLEWVDETDWIFTCRFTWTPSQNWRRTVLSFDMLDTIATVTLNGTVVGASESMFVPHEFEVSDAIVDGENLLEVHLASPVRTGIERRKEYFDLRGLAWDTPMFDERAFLRKGQWMSGWDWGPRVVSAGIGGAVRVLGFDNRLVRAQIRSEPFEEGYRVWLEAEIEGDGEATVVWGDGATGVEKFMNGPLWYPNGYGEPYLHQATIKFGPHETSTRFGLRTIEWRQEVDAHGQSFECLVNNIPVWCRGANLIPFTCFPHRENAAEVRASLEDFVAVHGNCLRIWGGGVYPSETFFDLCDELGILVWQDFMFACSHYPDSPRWQEMIREEATTHIKRLSGRASLALWCGNNEIQQMFEQTWGGAERFPERPHGPILWEEVIPETLEALGSKTAYISTSPFGSGPEVVDSPDPNKTGSNSGHYGDQHFWEVWHGSGDWTAYRNSRARFSSEFGFASFASRGVWESALGEHWDHPSRRKVLESHNKTGKTLERLHELVSIHYPECPEIQDFVSFSQCNQFDAMTCALESYRTQDFCRGALIWQWNDLWPALSWALRDSGANMKLAGIELKRLFHPLLFGALVHPAALEIRYAADGLVTVPDHVVIEHFDTATRTKIGETTLPISGPSREGELRDERGSLGKVAWVHEDPRREAAVIRHPGGQALDRWVFRSEPKDMTFASPLLSMVREGKLTPQEWVFG